MKFKLEMTRSWYCEKYGKDYEHLGFTKEYFKNKYEPGNDLFIEFSSLEELVKFAKDHDIIFNGETIEIYNDYRE